MSRPLRLLLNSIGLLPTEFAGRIAVVTGAGGGIGREVARSLAASGAAVVIAEISLTGYETEQAIRSEGGKALFVQTDVANQTSVDQMAAVVMKTFGPPDILINNAIYIQAARVEETDLKIWNQILSVNLTGAFLTVKAFLPDMLKQKHGIIINMVSLDAMPALAAYIASKQGLVGFSQTLDAEVNERGVRVIALAPGMVSTPGMQSVAGGVSCNLGLSEEQFMNFSLHPAYEGMMPVEHAGVATAYLAARLADETHGEIINGYEVLERAGLIKRPVVEQNPDKQVVSPIEGLSAPADLINLVQEFSNCLAKTAAEFDMLPVFIRPMARSGFKKRSGMSLADWGQYAMEVDTAARAADHEKLSQLAELLLPLTAKLIEYYRGVPGETARFSKDQEFLHEVVQRTNARITVVQSFAQALIGLLPHKTNYFKTGTAVV